LPYYAAVSLQLRNRNPHPNRETYALKIGTPVIPILVIPRHLVFELGAYTGQRIERQTDGRTDGRTNKTNIAA